VIDTVSMFAPGFGSLVEHSEVLTPSDLEARFGLLGGNIFHGEMSLDQLFSFRPSPAASGYRTPVRGLYLCGSGTHPGGGVMGIPGRNASRVIVRDARGVRAAASAVSARSAVSAVSAGSVRSVRSAGSARRSARDADRR
jgi:phytoene dehydrogenase-like protein